jgi:hypothetical protein
MIISLRAFDLIVAEETGGEAYYNKTEQSATWPGGASGVTIGIGYDCGYETAGTISADWSGKLPEASVAELCAVAGIHGTSARSHARELHNVDVPWAIALDVFRSRDVPRWEKLVQNGLLNTDRLSGDSFGALVSLAFNRGASFHEPGSRYTEMRAIASLMTTQQFEEIPAQIRAMARLWPSTKDLRDRRQHEAGLFEKGLEQNPASPRKWITEETEKCGGCYPISFQARSSSCPFSYSRE